MDPLKSLTSNTRPMTQATQAGSTKAQAKSSTPAPVAQQDEVSLTPQAQQLQKAEAALESANGIDMDKVNAVKAAIAEGRYQVDPQKLADNLARFESELNGLNG